MKENDEEDKEPLILENNVDVDIEKQPLVDDSEDDLISKSPRRTYIRIPFRFFVQVTVSLPLGGFLFCIIWSLYTNFEESTATHCKVKNYLPSISAAIGNFEVSLFIWRLCIYLHALPRFMMILMYYRYLSKVIFKRLYIWITIASFLCIMENLSLIGLTIASSKENYPIHEKCFMIFMISSELYMISMCFLLSHARYIPATANEQKSTRVKRNLVIINLVSFGFACYTFMRHNNFCEKGMYTYFAIFEYTVVLTNMGFHMTSYWDFYSRVLTIGPNGFKIH